MNNYISNIPDNLYSLNLDTNKIRPLNEQQNKIFIKATGILNTQIEKDRMFVVYRGENKNILGDTLSAIDENDFFYRFFHVGDKGKYFKQCEEYNQIEDINDISDNVFRFIFDRIYNIVNDNNEDNEFKHFFLDMNNKVLFSEKIGKIKDAKTKLRVRDYYLVYLHIIGKYSYHNTNECSYFVSTTKDIEVAEGYADEEENEIIIFYLLSKPFIDKAICARNKQFLKNSFKKLNLPIYEEQFPKENEISVKGALFPNWILGLSCFIDNKKSFFVNPYLFNMGDKLIDFVTIGFPTDQSIVKSTILKTNHDKYVTKYNDNNFEEINNLSDPMANREV